MSWRADNDPVNIDWLIAIAIGVAVVLFVITAAHMATHEREAINEVCRMNHFDGGERHTDGYIYCYKYTRMINTEQIDNFIQEKMK